MHFHLLSNYPLHSQVTRNNIKFLRAKRGMLDKSTISNMNSMDVDDDDEVEELSLESEDLFKNTRTDEDGYYAFVFLLHPSLYHLQALCRFC